MPGTGDNELDFDEFLKDIKRNLIGARLDAGIIVIKCHDNRFELKDRMAAEIYKNFFEELKP